MPFNISASPLSCQCGQVTITANEIPSPRSSWGVFLFYVATFGETQNYSKSIQGRYGNPSTDNVFDVTLPMNANYTFYGLAIAGYINSVTYSLGDWVYNTEDKQIYVSKAGSNTGQSLSNLIWWRPFDCSDIANVPTHTNNNSAYFKKSTLTQNVTCNTSFLGLVPKMKYSCETSVQTLAINDRTGLFDFECNPNGYGGLNPSRGDYAQMQILTNTRSNGVMTEYYARAYSYRSALVYNFDIPRDGVYVLNTFFVQLYGNKNTYNKDEAVFDSTTNQFYRCLADNVVSYKEGTSATSEITVTSTGSAGSNATGSITIVVAGDAQQAAEASNIYISNSLTPQKKATANVSYSGVVAEDDVFTLTVNKGAGNETIATYTALLGDTDEDVIDGLAISVNTNTPTTNITADAPFGTNVDINASIDLGSLANGWSWLLTRSTGGSTSGSFSGGITNIREILVNKGAGFISLAQHMVVSGDTYEIIRDALIVGITASEPITGISATPISTDGISLLAPLSEGANANDWIWKQIYLGGYGTGSFINGINATIYTATANKGLGNITLGTYTVQSGDDVTDVRDGLQASILSNVGTTGITPSSLSTNTITLTAPNNSGSGANTWTVGITYVGGFAYATKTDFLDGGQNASKVELFIYKNTGNIFLGEYTTQSFPTIQSVRDGIIAAITANANANGITITSTSTNKITLKTPVSAGASANDWTLQTVNTNTPIGLNLGAFTGGTDAIVITIDNPTFWLPIYTYEQFIESIVYKLAQSQFIQDANGRKLLYDLRQGIKSSCPCNCSDKCGDDLMKKWIFVNMCIEDACFAMDLFRYEEAQCFLEKIPKNCAPYISIYKC